MRVSCRSMALLSRRMEEEKGDGEGIGMLSLLRPAEPSCERCGVLLLLLCCLVIVVLGLLMVSGLGILLFS